MAKVRPVHYVLSVTGVSIIRNWAANPRVAVSRMADLASLVQCLGQGGPFDLEIDIAEIEVRAGHREWAATYDSLPNPLISVEEPVVHHLIDQIPRGRVLDAASGTGRHARYLLSRGHSVVAMDRTPEMLDKLRAQVPEVDCRGGDLENLPFPDQSFDAVICALALTHLKTLDRAIAEITRVVQPGGFVILSDFHPMPGFLGGGGFFQDKSWPVRKCTVVRALPFGIYKRVRSDWPGYCLNVASRRSETRRLWAVRWHLWHRRRSSLD
jgi:SAM-dependent methyltransferase